MCQVPCEACDRREHSSGLPVERYFTQAGSYGTQAQRGLMEFYRFLKLFRDDLLLV